MGVYFLAEITTNLPYINRKDVYIERDMPELTFSSNPFSDMGDLQKELLPIEFWKVYMEETNK
jgi:hypothetical protein